MQVNRVGYAISLLLATLSGALTALILSATPVFGTHDCPSDHRVIASPDTNGRGVRVANPGLTVVNHSVDCSQARTLSVVNSAETRAVEVGYYEETVNTTPCAQTSQPRILLARVFDGVFFCDQDVIGPDVISGTPRDDSFAVQDADQDGDWKYYHEGEFLGFLGLGTFTTGDPRAQGERQSTHDSASANHHGLTRMNSSQAWVGWTGTSIVLDTDSTYRGCIESATWFRVTAGTC
jgi:hypothetical protein